MRIKIDLSKKSIENAIKQIKEVQKKIQKDLPKVYLQKCVEWIKAEANKNLWMTDIGSDVKGLIQDSWKMSKIENNRVVLSNNAQFEEGKNLAVFVEFGVGIVGYENSHEKADEANYEYNVLTWAKDQEGAWSYTLDSANRMNIESKYYEAIGLNGDFQFVTKGSPATMFLFKAWKTFETSGMYKELWEQAKAEVIG